MSKSPHDRLIGLNRNYTGINVTFAAMMPMIKRLIRYGIVGGVGMVVYLVMLGFLVEILGQDPVLSSVVAFVVLTIFLYIFNRFWVFEANRGHGYSVPRFLVISGAALLLNTGVMHVTVNVLGWTYLLGQLAATGIVPPTNFLLMYYWSFK